MPPRISITKIFTFEAAHSLPNHRGKCRRPHGHSYKLEVTLAGPLKTRGSSQGMVMDFADVSRLVKREIITQWDHHSLNDLFSFPTTAENLALEAFRRLKAANLPVVRVRLWETTTSYAEVNAHDME